MTKATRKPVSRKVNGSRPVGSTNGKTHRNGKASSNGKVALNGKPHNGTNGHNGHSPADLFAPELDLDLPAIDTDEEPTLDELEQEELDAEQDLTGGDDRIDDPVRIYLMQMGEIPLLTRKEEVAAAKRIERARGLFRHSMLATDFILQAAISLLEKGHIMRLIEPNLETLHHLLRRNQHDFFIVINRRKPMNERREAWHRLVCRRSRAVRLIEELGLRTQRLQPLFRVGWTSCRWNCGRLKPASREARAWSSCARSCGT